MERTLKLLNRLIKLCIEQIKSFGSYVLFSLDSFRRIVYPPISSKLLLQQMEFVGNRSFTIILMSSVMVGAVFGLQFGQIFKIFGVESLIGAAASMALSKELSPVVGAFLVTGRAGSSMAAEIASMKVNEQIDAMKVMSVNPIAYLASPRILASMLMMPLLTGLFTVGGVASAFVIGVLIFDIDKGVFFEKITWIMKTDDVLEGLNKAMLFGIVFSTVSCHQGFSASGGAKGVGQVTTRAVVISLVLILISDFFISYFHQRSFF